MHAESAGSLQETPNCQRSLICMHRDAEKHVYKYTGADMAKKWRIKVLKKSRFGQGPTSVECHGVLLIHEAKMPKTWRGE